MTCTGRQLAIGLWPVSPSLPGHLRHQHNRYLPRITCNWRPLTNWPHWPLAWITWTQRQMPYVTGLICLWPVSPVLGGHRRHWPLAWITWTQRQMPYVTGLICLWPVSPVLGGHRRHWLNGSLVRGDYQRYWSNQPLASIACTGRPPTLWSNMPLFCITCTGWPLMGLV